MASRHPTVIFTVNSLPSPKSMADSTSSPTILTSPSTVVVTALVFCIIKLCTCAREGGGEGGPRLCVYLGVETQGVPRLRWQNKPML